MSFSPEIIQQIKNMYEQDANSTYTSIGNIFHVTRKVIARLLKKNGIKPKVFTQKTELKQKPKNDIKVFFKKIIPKPPTQQLVQCSMAIYCYQSCTHRKHHFPLAMLNKDRVCTKHIFCEVVNKACYCRPIKKKEFNHVKVKKDQNKQKDCQKIKKDDGRILL